MDKYVSKNPVDDVEDKRTDDVEDKRIGDVEDKRTADIKAVKGPMKRIMLQMMPLIKPAQRMQEAETMFTLLAVRLDKIKKEITTLTEEEMLQLLGEEED